MPDFDPAQVEDPRALIIAAEQRVVDDAYRLLDARRRRARQSLAEVLSDQTTETPQSRTEREVLAARHAAHVNALEAAEEQLVFGRIDQPGSRSYVGRIGLRDSRREAVLLDWRADAAIPFFRATAARPGQLLLRRRLRLEARRVTDVHDDLVPPGHEQVGTVVLDGAEAALLAAVQRPRTGRMSDVVATLQAEQDAIIRADLRGILLVEGAPGTGKTVVALHRVAYLLHRHRDHLERRGVLFIGPSSRFLTYVSQVLPGLGETSLTSASIPELYPVPGPLREDPPEVARLKGSEDMAPVLAAAVHSQHRVPPEPVPIEVEGVTVWLKPETVRAAQHRARATGDPHNLARDEYCAAVLDDLVLQLEGLADASESSNASLRRLLTASPDVRREVNLCWMPRTPEYLLDRLFTDQTFLAECAPTWNVRRRALLHRVEGRAWSQADIPLLDHLAELLGPLPTTTCQGQVARAAAAERRELVAYAADTLNITDLGAVLTPEMLADRYDPASGVRRRGGGAEREDTFGHVVVDEAQDLSPMEWRMVVRRCPSRSMTIVGDPHQATAHGAARDWTEPLRRWTRGRWRRHSLSVNYRVPAGAMDMAVRALAPHAQVLHDVTSLRAGQPPIVVSCREADDATLRRRAVEAAQDLASSSEGTVALVLPPGLYGAIDLPPGAEQRVTVLAPQQVKGLEFDHVVIVEPAILADDASLRSRMLYICLTRATQTVTLVHRRPLPRGLRPGPTDRVRR